MVDRVVLIGIEIVDGQTLLHALFFDEYNSPVLQIVHSEVVYSLDTWDIEFSGQILTLRSAPRDLLLRMRFDPAGLFVIDRANLYCNGVHIRIMGGDVIANDAVTMTQCTFQTSVGLMIGWSPQGHLRLASVCSPPGTGVRLLDLSQ